jgi:hypothetical protein
MKHEMDGREFKDSYVGQKCCLLSINLTQSTVAHRVDPLCQTTMIGHSPFLRDVSKHGLYGRVPCAPKSILQDLCSSGEEEATGSVACAALAPFEVSTEVATLFVLSK